MLWVDLSWVKHKMQPLEFTGGIIWDVGSGIVCCFG